MRKVKDLVANDYKKYKEEFDKIFTSNIDIPTSMSYVRTHVETIEQMDE